MIKVLPTKKKAPLGRGRNKRVFVEVLKDNLGRMYGMYTIPDGQIFRSKNPKFSHYQKLNGRIVQSFLPGEIVELEIPAGHTLVGGLEAVPRE